MINPFKKGYQAGVPLLPKTRLKADSKISLFCFPYAGGTTSTYSNWDSVLPPAIEACPVELPGRAGRRSESPATSIIALVESMTPALLPYLDKPFAFFGHSMGALISFEFARELRRSHELAPEHMFVSACRAPHGYRSRQKVSYDLPEPEFIEELHRLNGTPREVLEHSELMQLIMPLLRADFQACQTYDYVHEPPLDCALTVFGGLQDRELTRSELEDWCGQTTSSCTVRMLPGDHFFINTAQSPILRMVVDQLSAWTR